MKEKMENFLHRREILKGLRKAAARGRKSLVVPFEQILKFDMALAKSLLDNPTDFLDTADATLEGITKVPGMRMRVMGLDSTVEIRNIRAGQVGKFIQVEGVLTRSGEVKPEAKVAVFKCQRCGEVINVPQATELFREPFICYNPNCGKKGPFDLVVEKSEFRDWQSLSIQEPPEKLRGGRMPRRLNGIVRDDFVDKAVPGNHVVMTGILHVFQEGPSRQRKTVFRKLLFVSHSEVLQKGVEETELTPEDEKKIEELAKDPWIRNKIIQSIAPSIYGYEAIKEAIALQLFGCNPVVMPDGTRIRGDTHILLSGDPGTAKSQLLKWVSNVAPRGLYTSGMKATGAGLTATAVRDEISGGWMLEAGALVIADGGLASIDEFEKMRPEDANAILESLEQQTISVAKAGIVATLNSRTAVLAAANPKLGRFDKNIPIGQQIAIPPVLLSRFDLIFPVRDEPQAERDRMMAHHVLQLHSAPEKVVKPPFDADFLRKVIIYARKNVDPELKDKEVMKGIEDFFVEWRKVAETGEAPLPITVRQLEGVVRLAKANARMRLSDRVTKEDANRAINLIKCSLQEAGTDIETGKVDIDVFMTGRGKSQREKVQRVLEIIKELEGQYEGAAPVQEIRRIAQSEGISSSFVDVVIDQGKRDGTLYEPKPDMISRAVRA